jgi:intron-binding protein aquarius
MSTMAPRAKGLGAIPRDVDNDRPTVADLQGDNPFAQLAKKYWLDHTKKAGNVQVKVKPEVLKKEIWDVLEQEDFPYRSLLVLENLQILERQIPSYSSIATLLTTRSYLWPGYCEDSNNYHVLLIALITNVRSREHLPTWSMAVPNLAARSGR